MKTEMIERRGLSRVMVRPKREPLTDDEQQQLAISAAPPRKMTLIEIVDNIAQINEFIDTATTDEERDAAMNVLQRLVTEELPTKVDGLGWFKKRTEVQTKALKDEKEEFNEAIDRGIARLNSQWERVKGLCCQALGTAGAKFKGSVYTISRCEGKKSLRIDNELEVPDEYKTVRFCLTAAQYAALEQMVPVSTWPGVRITTEIDETAVRNALNANIEVPGAAMKPGEDYVKVI